MERNLLLCFRATLAAAVLVTGYLAVTPVAIHELEVVSDKLQHAAAFYVLAFLLDFALPRSRFGWRKAAAVLGYGALIEIVQYFLPWRDSSVLDFLADCAGVALYLASAPLLARLPVLRGRGRVDDRGG
jgi:VanZ family protein